MESSILLKSMLLIEHLAGSGEQSLGSIASAVSQTRPTVHRILSSLIGLGYVARTQDGVYGLTNKLRLVALGGDEARLAGVAEKWLVNLRSRTGETANLGVLRGLNVRYLATLESSYPLRRVVIAGESDPFYCTALGRVLASGLTPARVTSMLKAARLVKRSAKTEIDPKRIQQLIRAATIDGYAIEHDQTDVGVSCIAAPVVEDGEILAAVSISGVGARIKDWSMNILVRHVRDAAMHISKELRLHSAD